MTISNAGAAAQQVGGGLLPEKGTTLWAQTLCLILPKSFTTSSRSFYINNYTDTTTCIYCHFRSCAHVPWPPAVPLDVCKFQCHLFWSYADLLDVLGSPR